MKRSFVLIISLLFVSLFGINVYAKGDSIEDAYTINLNKPITINYGEYEHEKFVKFVPTASGYYEFETKNPTENSTYLTLTNANDDELFFTGTNSKTGKAVAYGNLAAGQAYYLQVDNYAFADYNLSLTVRKHTHNYKLSSSSVYMNYVYYSCDCNVDKSGTVSAKLSSNSYTYDGKIKTPSVSVVNTAGIKIQNKKHYSVSYQSGRKNVGTYKITIRFMDAYSNLDNIVKTFRINPKNSNKLVVKPAKRSLKVSWKKQTAQTTGYKLRYSTKKSMNGAKTITIKKNKIKSYKIKRLKSKKRYYVQIRTYKVVDGKNYYSGWSTSKSVKVK